MPWIKRKLRGNKVFVRVDDKGEPCKNERGLVEILYKLGANSKIYNASVSNLMPTGDPEDAKPVEYEDTPEPAAEQPEPKSPSGGNSKAKMPGSSAGSSTASEEAIIIYTDGACSNNPGPMGIGAVVMNKGERHEISEFIGIGTNNIAELTAIEQALLSLPSSDRDSRVVVHTDSSYSIGLLNKGWKAKANKELVARIRKITAQFTKLEFVKVKGHAGIPENERCDELATSAVIRNQ